MTCFGGQFVECLYVRFDFDAAHENLKECSRVLENDFFLVACEADFTSNARAFIFEVYCTIHSTIDIATLGDKLGMSSPEAERFVVDLIRNARYVNQLLLFFFFVCRYVCFFRESGGVVLRSLFPRVAVNPPPPFHSQPRPNPLPTPAQRSGTRLDAKIDSGRGHVIMGNNAPTLYQQVWRSVVWRLKKGGGMWLFVVVCFVFLPVR